MEIYLTKDYAYGEPGPNLVWLTNKQSIHELIDKICDLCADKIFEIRIQNDPSVTIRGFNSILFKKNQDGHSLIRIDKDGTVISELPKAAWLSLVSQLQPLAHLCGFQYMEIEGMEGLIEDATWIVECRPDSKPV